MKIMALYEMKASYGVEYKEDAPFTFYRLKTFTKFFPSFFIFVQNGWLLLFFLQKIDDLYSVKF
jgi:hypothetical protein